MLHSCVEPKDKQYRGKNTNLWCSADTCIVGEFLSESFLYQNEVDHLHLISYPTWCERLTRGVLPKCHCLHKAYLGVLSVEQLRST